MWDLFLELAGRLCIFIVLIFLFTRLRKFRSIYIQQLNIKDKLLMISIFGTLGVLGNYIAVVISFEANILSGVVPSHLEHNNAVADTRNIGVILGGFLGGPFVGISTGFIAGFHRYLLGGFINTPVLITTIMGGMIAGLMGKKLSLAKMDKPLKVTILSLCILTAQIILIPGLSSYPKEALNLIKFTGVPIIIINVLGIWICSMIIHIVINEEEKTRAIQTQKVMVLAAQTLPYFRQGLNSYSAKNVAKIIYDLMFVDAVVITNKQKILTQIGKEETDPPENTYEAALTKKVLTDGETIITRKLDCHNRASSFNSAIILPLKIKEQTIGTLKIYFKNKGQLTTVEEELAQGLTNLFSTQLELGDVERHSKLLRDAEMKALQAQTHPHFLFNSISVIVSLCRTNPLLARDLLLSLSTYLRNNLEGTSESLIPMYKELECVEAYFALEEARFPNHFALNKEIEKGLEEVQIPPFILQPLVENALIHGFSRSEKGVVSINAKKEKGFLMIIVTDNGCGIPKEILLSLGDQTVHSSKRNGIAIYNIRQRIKLLFGSDGMFSVHSGPKNGTKVFIKIPLIYSNAFIHK